MATYSDYSNVVNARTWEAETATLLARASAAPSAALATLINTTIKGLKDDGVFAKGDILYIRGLHESTLSLQNWIKNAHNSTLHGNVTPTHTPKVGFTGRVATDLAYINDNYKLFSQAVNYTLTAGTIAYMHPTLGTVNNTSLFGASKSSAPACYITCTLRTANTELMYFNSGDGTTNDNVNVANGDYITYTLSSGSVQGYKNGASSGAADTPTVAAALHDIDILELASKTNTAAGGYYDGTTAFFFMGGLLTPTQVLALYTRISYFYANVGGTF